MKTKQELKGRLKKLEKRLKDIGNLSLEFINQHQVDHGKDNEWEIAIAINKAAHKAYDEVQEIKT